MEVKGNNIKLSGVMISGCSNFVGFEEDAKVGLRVPLKVKRILENGGSLAAEVMSFGIVDVAVSDNEDVMNLFGIANLEEGGLHKGDVCCFCENDDIHVDVRGQYLIISLSYY